MKNDVPSARGGGKSVLKAEAGWNGIEMPGVKQETTSLSLERDAVHSTYF